MILPLLLLLAMGGSRIAYRAWKEHGLMAVMRAPDSNPAIVLGAGDAAATLLKELAAGREWHVVGLLDDDSRKHGGEIMGVKVMGPLALVGDLAERFNASQAIIAMPGESHASRKRAVDLCNAAGLSVMTVPSYAELVSGKLSVSQLRNVELDDLLGRDPGAARRGRIASLDRRQADPGHRRRRVDRRGIVPADRPFCARAGGAVRIVRVRALHDRIGVSRSIIPGSRFPR